ncbi:MAG: hypothetical protein ACN4GF_10565 [Lentimonas sp.]
MNSTIYEGYLESDQVDTLSDERFTHRFFAQIGAPELVMSQSGSNLSFKYLQSTQDIDQFASYTVAESTRWASESSTLMTAFITLTPSP